MKINFFLYCAALLFVTIIICRSQEASKTSPKLKTEIIMANGDKLLLNENFSEIRRFFMDDSGNTKGYRFHWVPETGTFVIYRFENDESSEVAVATFWDDDIDRAIQLRDGVPPKN